MVFGGSSLGFVMFYTGFWWNNYAESFSTTFSTVIYVNPGLVARERRKNVGAVWQRKLPSYCRWRSNPAPALYKTLEIRGRNKATLSGASWTPQSSTISDSSTKFGQVAFTDHRVDVRNFLKIIRIRIFLAIQHLEGLCVTTSIIHKFTEEFFGSKQVRFKNQRNKWILQLFMTQSKRKFSVNFHMPPVELLLGLQDVLQGSALSMPMILL